MDMHLMGVHFIGVHLMGARFMGVHLMGMRLTGTHLYVIAEVTCPANYLRKLPALKRPALVLRAVWGA
jgi:hypothetical protein